MEPKLPLYAIEDERPLRVALITENFLPKIDGVTRTLSRLLQHLRTEGVEVLVLGPESGLQTYEGHKVRGTRGIPLVFYPELSLNFFRPMFLRELQSFDPDVVHYVDPIWLGAQSQSIMENYFSDVQAVSSYHTNLAMYSDMYRFSFLTKYIWQLQLYLHGRCAFTFCPSPSTRKALSSKGFRNMRIWPRGVDVSLFSPSKRDFALRAALGAENSATKIASLEPSLPLPNPQDFVQTEKAQSKLVITYVGRLGFEKNLHLLIEAFNGLEQAARQHPSFDYAGIVLQIVGHGPAQASLQTLAKKYALNAVFAGYRKAEELARCYASSDIMAFPSVSETFGQVVLEAQACGLPVVGMRAEGVSDLVVHGERGLLLDLDHLRPESATEITATTAHLLFQPGSESLANAVFSYRQLLLQLVIDRPLRERMSNNAVEFAQTQSWSSAMSCVVTTYRELAAITRRKKAEKLMKTLSRNSSSSSLASTASLHEVLALHPEDLPLTAKRRRLRAIFSRRGRTEMRHEMLQRGNTRALLILVALCVAVLFWTYMRTTTYGILQGIHAASLVDM